MMERLFTAHQVSDLLGMTPLEVGKWIREGWLATLRLPDGSIRVSERALVTFLKQRGVDIGQLMSTMARQQRQTPPAAPRRAPAPTAASNDAEGGGAVDQAVEDGERSALLDVPVSMAATTAVEDQPTPPASDEGPAGAHFTEDKAFEAVSRETPRIKSPIGLSAPGAPVEAAAPEASEPQAGVERDGASAPTGEAAPNVPPQSEDSSVAPAEADTGEPASVPTCGPRADDAAAATPDCGVAAQITHAVLSDALRRSATHVHLESRADGLALRLRVDGLLQDKPNFHARLPEGMPPKLIDHLLSLAGLAAADRAQPQRGCFVYPFDGRTVAMELTSFPTAHGPRLVVCPAAQPARTFADLGLDEAQVTRLERLVAAGGGGLVLVAGPPAGGGGDWLAALAGLAGGTRSIVTLESLGRTDVAGANRVRLDPFAGQTTARAAQGLWRQDADVVVVEELLDPSTATTALLLALAGSTVLAGVRAADAADAVALLLEMNLEPWSLALALKAVIAWRRARRLCGQCAQPHLAGAAAAGDDHARLELSSADLASARRPVGCPSCGHTGYAGTMGLAAVLVPDAGVRRAIRTGKPEPVAMAVSAAMGGGALRAAAIQRLRQGVIGLEEFARAGV
jgi:general secretion pathway protein E